MKRERDAHRTDGTSVDEPGWKRYIRYRRISIGLGTAGVAAVVAAVIVPTLTDLFLVLGGTGLFLAIVGYYITPESFITTTVSEQVYNAAAANYESLSARRDVQDVHVYIPVEIDGEQSTRLFLPERVDYTLPDATALDSTLIETDDERSRGISLLTTGGCLYREFSSSFDGGLENHPEYLSEQLAAGLVNVLELADSATPNRLRDDEIVMTVTSRHGSIDDIDHPIVSFVATGFAIGLQRPVAATASAAGANRGTQQITCEWDIEEERRGDDP